MSVVYFICSAIMLGLAFVFGLANDDSDTKNMRARINLMAIVFSVVFFGACAIGIVTLLVSK